VEETAHIIQLASITSRRELELIQWLGLNARWNPQPKLTPHPEVRALRPIFLRRLATAIRARLLCEVGTARGLQAVFFAEHLAFGSAGEGWVYTCDVTGHDEPKYYTPFSDEKVWTRRELWSSQPISSMITFVHGDSASLASRLRDDLGDERIDLLFIDAVHTEKAVLNDYHNLLPLISENTVIVFDDCDPCFPGVERAVAAIAEERAAGVQLVDFWPAPYRVAIMGNPLRLSKLMRKDAAPEGMGAPLSV
jgi:predicted O-methyltransferase YrrM